MMSARPATWTTRQWLLLVAVLLLIIVALILLWPRASAAPENLTVRVVNGPTVISTQVVRLQH